MSALDSLPIISPEKLVTIPLSLDNWVAPTMHVHVFLPRVNPTKTPYAGFQLAQMVESGLYAAGFRLDPHASHDQVEVIRSGDPNCTNALVGRLSTNIRIHYILQVVGIHNIMPETRPLFQRTPVKFDQQLKIQLDDTKSQKKKVSATRKRLSRMRLRKSPIDDGAKLEETKPKAESMALEESEPRSDRRPLEVPSLRPQQPVSPEQSVIPAGFLHADPKQPWPLPSRKKIVGMLLGFPYHLISGVIGDVFALAQTRYIDGLCEQQGNSDDIRCTTSHLEYTYSDIQVKARRGDGPLWLEYMFKGLYFPEQ